MRPVALAVILVVLAVAVLYLPGRNAAFALPAIGGCAIALVLRLPPLRSAAIAAILAGVAAFAFLVAYTLIAGIGTQEDDKWPLFAVLSVIFPALCALLAAPAAALVSLVIRREQRTR